MKRVLITGAGGFIGGYLAQAALKRDMKVYAGVRKSTDVSRLETGGIELVVLDYSDVESLAKEFRKLNFDYLIHNAGMVSAPSLEMFEKVNCQLFNNVIDAVKLSGIQIEKLAFMSSLAAYGPADPDDFTDMVSNEKEPNPITDYGRSKLKAEGILKESGLPYIILRPTVVYGPWERDLLTFFKMVAKGYEAHIGFKKQRLTFTHVNDLTRMIMLALEAEVKDRAYFVTDGRYYSAEELAEITKEHLKKKTFKVKVPIWVVRLVATGVEAFSKISKRYPILTKDKVNELEQTNWQCDIRPQIEDLGFVPEYDLKKGIPPTLDWYLEKGWIG